MKDSAYISKNYDKHIDKQIKTIVVLGCNEYSYVPRLKEKYNPEIIYAFEADPTLAEWCEENPIENVIFNHFAVCDVDGTVDFYESYDGGQGSLYERYSSPPFYPSGNEIQKEKIKVNATRLDTFFSDNPEIKLDMICMDIQGAELPALKGLGSIIENVSYIILEVPKSEDLNYHKNGYSVEELYSFLIDRNFHPVEYQEENDIEDNVFFARR